MKTLISLLLFLVSTSYVPVDEDCGVERWDVKTLTDGATVHLTTTLPMTVEQIREVPRPAKVGRHTPRFPFEQNVISITGKIVFYKPEGDKDIHAVLSDDEGTIIVEFPDVTCPAMSGSRIVEKATKAKNDFDQIIAGQPRNQFFPGIPVHITGVAFFDVIHPTPQIGVAPNGIELHPVLSITPAP